MRMTGVPSTLDQQLTKFRPLTRVASSMLRKATAGCTAAGWAAELHPVVITGTIGMGDIPAKQLQSVAG